MVAGFKTVVTALTASGATAAGAHTGSSHLEKPNFEGDCTSISAAQLNHYPADCKNIKSPCFNQIENVKGIGQECLGKLTDDVLGYMKDKQASVIAAGEPRELPMTERFLRHFLAKDIWKDVAVKNKIIEYIVKETAFIKTLLRNKQFPRHLIAHLLTKEGVAMIAPKLCADFDGDLPGYMDDDALSEIKSECVSKLPDSFLGALQQKNLKKMNAESMDALTGPKLKAIPTSVSKYMTAEQIRNLGAPPNPPEVIAPEGEERKKQEEERRKFLENHPCRACKNLENNLVSPAAKRAFKDRCSRLNGANMLKLPIVAMTGLLLGTLLFLL